MKQEPSGEGPIVVVGAGMAGLGAALTLLRGGREVVVLERQDYVGGLARTIAFDEHIFDVGPHYFFLDVNDEVNALVRSCMTDDEWRSIDFKIGAFIGKHHVPWPPSLSAVFKLPLTGIFQHLRASVRAALPQTYVAQEFLESVYGRVMYELFLGPYLKKKIPTEGGPSQLHRDWYNQAARTSRNQLDVARDKGLQMEPELVREYMERHPEVAQRLAEERAREEREGKRGHHQGLLTRTLGIFIGLAKTAMEKNYKPVLYPPGGVGVITQRMAEAFTKEGGTLHLKAANVSLERDGDRVTRVTWDGGSVENPQEVVWTGSIHRLCALLEVPREELPFITILLGMMKMRKPFPPGEDLYTYVAYPDIVFNRIYYPNRSIAGLCPPGKDSLCVEVTPTEQREQTLPDNVEEEIYSGLEKLNICRREDVEEIQFVWVPEGYPVYPLDYREKLTRIWEEIDTLSNLRSIGRSGQFWYNNMARSMGVGIETAQDVLGAEEGG